MEMQQNNSFRPFITQVWTKLSNCLELPIGYVGVENTQALQAFAKLVHKTGYYRVFRKNCVFFTIHCNPQLAFITVREFQSSQRNASVQSLLLAGNFLYNQQQPIAGEGEVANFHEFLEKNTIFNEHPVVHLVKRQVETADLKWHVGTRLIKKILVLLFAISGGLITQS